MGMGAAVENRNGILTGFITMVKFTYVCYPFNQLFYLYMCGDMVKKETCPIVEGSLEV